MDDFEKEEERHRRRIMLMRMQGETNRMEHRRNAMVLIAAFLLFFAITLGPMIAHGSELSDPYACFGAGRYDAMREGRECPRPAKVAWYCRPFVGMERSCTSVKAVVKTLGAVRAENLARKCGASDQEIEQAKACLSQ